VSWSYSFNPGSTPKDQVRFLIGDTDSTDPLLQDEEIVWVLSKYNNSPINAAIRCCESVVGKFSRLANETVGQVRIEFKQKAEGYMKLLTMLKTRLATEDATPYAGGISISDKITVNQNTDRVKPDFKKHMMENEQIAPWTTQTEASLFLLNED
jgi:hypothetical protein